MEDDLLVDDAVALAVDEDADLVLGRTIVAARDEHAAFAPSLCAQRTTSVRILRGLGDPHATSFVPLDRDRLMNEGLVGDDAGLEPRLHLEGRDGLLRSARAAGGITEVGQVLGRTELVDVLMTSDPSDASLDEGAITGVGERGGVTLQEDRRTHMVVREDPGLRLDVEDGSLVGDLGDLLARAGDLGSERGSHHVDLLVEIEFEDGVVSDVKSGSVLGERVRIRAEIEHHQRAEAAAVRRPTGAEGVLAPGSGRAGDGAADGHEADSAMREVGERGAIDDLIRHVVLAVQQDDFVLLVGLGDEVTRLGGLGDDRAGRSEFRRKRLERGGIVRDEGHLDRGGAKGERREDQAGTQEGGDAGKHGLIKVSPPKPTRLSGSPSRNPTPLRCTLRTDFSLRPESATGRGRSTS